jgi:hypothetical protein
VNKSTRLIALAILAFSAACSKDKGGITPPPVDTTVTPPPPPPPPPTDTLHPPPPPPPPVDTAFVTLFAAGNIARCQNPATAGGDPAKTSNGNADATAKIIDSVPGATVLTLGNAANQSGQVEAGTASAYNGCYNNTWGKFLDRTIAVIGNHDYDAASGNPNAESFFAYFGGRAGPSTSGYFSFDRGAWHIIVLNVENGANYYNSSSPQQTWLASDLAANSAKCTIAAFHTPRFYSSGSSGGTTLPTFASIWTQLYNAGVDVILNGGAYQYERMFPMNAAGARDDAKGIVQFNAGMGGESSASVPTGVHPSSVKLLNSFGVLKLTLRAQSYDWAYVNANGVVEDSGTGNCH